MPLSSPTHALTSACSLLRSYFFSNDPATTEIYTTANTLSLHDALPILAAPQRFIAPGAALLWVMLVPRSEEHTSELQSLAVISYAVFCLKKKICLGEVVPYYLQNHRKIVPPKASRDRHPGQSFFF